MEYREWPTSVGSPSFVKFQVYLFLSLYKFSSCGRLFFLVELYCEGVL